ncbi:uncharacterized protein F4812DRAFT_436098 [Daldinia caldariorum]|uniref:uncharacterized protein n=1 Tax=Daldinia caldariorum TaxID=326644 RepID=UPI00200721E2|nr:uncharacterized protein F4812DRAFT_436098 [Daldinia caldariorum]KAI1466148.1 hypothetical protein F4812DRAFT_436098 [Daldinia caldariorum]
MATVDVNRDDNEVIIVTLVCRPHGSLVPDIPKRQFVLSRQNPSIRIGRASKVPTKGFVASIDNAWFDSPVMSRNHAELVLDLDSIPKSVLIKDIGSLHGTFHIPHDGIGKEMRLEQQRPVRLSDGDCLRFGTDIFRTKETFPPCSVEFYMIGEEHEPPSEDIPTTNQSPNRTFTIPDDDLDDEDDDDDDSVIETCMPTSHKNNIQRGMSIDLTQDEDDSEEEKNFTSSTMARNHLSSDIIDLTSEPDKHSDHETHAISPPHYSTSSTHPNPQEEYRAMAARIADFGYLRQASTDKSEKPTAFFFDSDTSSKDSHHFAQSDKVSSDIHLTDSQDGSVIIGEDDESSVGEDLNYNSSTDAVHDVVQSEGWEDDNDSILLCSESDDNSSSSGDEMMDTLSDSSSAAPSSSPSSSPNPPVPNALPGTGVSAESPNAERLLVTPFLFTASAQQDASAAQRREPSPSDAAMFKSHPVLDRTTSISRAHALGEKSGKHAFFAARESNRANRFDWLSPPPVSAIRETLSADADQHPHVLEFNHGPHTALPTFRIEDGQNVSTERAADTDNALDAKSHCPTTILGEELADSNWQPWSISGERFINHPRNEELPCSYLDRPQSPELDMTSAYTFQLSKMASESSSSLASKPRRVEIQDLLSQEPNAVKNDNHCEPIASLAPTAPSATSSAPLPPIEAVSEPQTKRSFDDAFGDDVDVLGSNEGYTHQEDEESKFGSSSKQTQDTAAANMESNDNAVATVPREGGNEVQPETVPARRDNVQPSKRRRFAQAAAYVALGGAAAFTYMVSTAPVL